jgi:hypothetical protein
MLSFMAQKEGLMIIIKVFAESTILINRIVVKKVLLKAGIKRNSLSRAVDSPPLSAFQRSSFKI